MGVEFFAQRKFLFLFPRQYIMSLGDPIFSFTLHKNTLKVPTKPTLLIWFTHLKHRASAMQYPLVLPAALLPRSPLVNPLSLSVYTCLQRGHWSQSHKTWKAEMFPAGLRCIFPRTRGARPKGSPQWVSFPTLRPSTQPLCQRCGERKYSLLLWNLFLRRAASPGQGAKKRCISGDPAVPLLANLFDHVWLAACMSAG